MKTGLLQTSFHRNARNMAATTDGVVMVGGPWTLKFIEADTGDVRWSVNLSGPVDTIVSDEEKVYVAGDAGQIVEAYNLQTGKLVWKVDLALPSHSGYYLELQEQGLYVYQLGQEEAIYVFDPQTGGYIDKIPLFDIGGQRYANLLVLKNQERLQSKNEAVVFIQDGQVVWQTELEGIPRKFPLFNDDLAIIYFEDDKSVFNGLAGIHLTSGDINWRRPGEFLSNFVIMDELLYVISKESDILTIDPDNGQTVGWAEVLPNIIDTMHPVSGIAADGDMLYAYFGDSRELIAFERIEE